VQVSPRESWCSLSNDSQIDIVLERLLPRVNFKDFFSITSVWQVDSYPPVESSWSKESRV
jgi:hypothetical protein